MPKLSFKTKLETFTPVVVRLLARRVVKGQSVALTDREVATRSGLTLAEVRTLSRLTTWEDVVISTMFAFMQGCGADLDDRLWVKKNNAYMSSLNRLPCYLTRHPDWESTFQPLMMKLLRSAA